MSTDEERIYSIALTQIPGVGHIGAKRLVDGMGSATDVFRYRTELPDRLPGVNRAVVAALDSPQALKRAEQEYEFARNNRISCFTLADEDYPSRLRECDDAPVVLFFKGKANLNALHIINMVGTRNATDYGKHICVSFLQELQMQCPDVLVVSGLAYGIDINAHRSALSVELPTVGVLAHGLDRIYPSLHRKTAIDMLRQGGLLTEFLSGTNPDKHNFISRNRIVASISDATIVVESAAKGGSLITADIAGSYHRDCFAFPGRVTDEYSKGCNQLIQDNKAVLLTFQRFPKLSKIQFCIGLCESNGLGQRFEKCQAGNRTAKPLSGSVCRGTENCRYSRKAGRSANKRIDGSGQYSH